MARSTRSRVSERTPSNPVTTREAVATLTPACWATSRREAILRPCVTHLQDGGNKNAWRNAPFPFLTFKREENRLVRVSWTQDVLHGAAHGASLERWGRCP